MIRFTLRRLAVALGVMFVVSLLTFTFTNIAVDPAVSIAGEGARDSDIELVRKQYGFDRPYTEQYVDWLQGWLSGDFGTSIRQRRPVSEMLAERFPVTILLACLSMALGLIISIPLGVLGALHPNSWIDRMALTIAVLGMATPNFWFGLMAIIVFGVTLRWLPISGSETLAHFVLPTLTLGYYVVPTLMRLTRAGMIEVLDSDYIRTARAKGLLERTVLFKHGLRNAIIPVVALAAVQFGHLLGGSVVVEAVFALRGVGHLAWEAIVNADLPVIQAVVVLMAAVYIALVFLSDVLNAYFDPRIRVS